MRRELSTWRKPINRWMPLSLYAAIHFVFLEPDASTALQIGLAASITALVNLVPEKSMGMVGRSLLVATAGASMFLLDETMVPDLTGHFRMRIILPLALLITALLTKGRPVSSVWNAFLGLTVVCLFVYSAYSLTRTVEFKTESHPANPLFESLKDQLESDEAVTLVLADGYPSDSVLEDRYGIRFRLDSLLKDCSYRPLHTRHTSTPISVSNLLFGAVFEKEDTDFGMRGRLTEVELLRNALEASTLNDMLERKDPIWASFIVDEDYNRYLDLPWWKRERFRSLFGRLTLQHFEDRNAQNVKIHRYNGRVLEDYLKSMNEKGHRTDFIFLHLLTFHMKDKTMRQQVEYADSLILRIQRMTPRQRRLILFSDHGSRDSGLDASKMRSGILIVPSR